MNSEEVMLEFQQAVKYMDPMQVNDYLHKILDFLKRDNHELYFPNISPYVEVFLVGIVTDIRNLKCNSFTNENKRLSSDIYRVLEMTKNVFRWTHSYHNGKLAKNVLVYTKIYFNNMKKDTEPWLAVVMDSMMKTRLSKLNTKQQVSSKEACNTQTLTPSDMRRKEKRKTKRAASFAQACRQPAVMQNAKVPSMPAVKVKSQPDLGKSQGVPKCAEKAIPSQVALNLKPGKLRNRRSKRKAKPEGQQKPEGRKEERELQESIKEGLLCHSTH